MTNLVFCLMGPTASGKTDLACALQAHFPCEIISVDSAMIYRGMRIGTASQCVDRVVAYKVTRQKAMSMAVRLVIARVLVVKLIPAMLW